MKSIFYLIVISVISINILAQDDKGKIENVYKTLWSDNLEYVEIPSSFDSEIQKAWSYSTNKKTPQPLIVSLHTWSGDYNQEDPIAEEILLRDWNYIHPDFRGPNNNPQACGSELVITDIKDAIKFAINNFNVDTTNIHIVGVSGGGYATLVSYLSLDIPITSFNAWVPISNLEDWYWESCGRKNKYSSDLEKVTSNGNGFNPTEARRRSPIFMDQIKINQNSILNIYTGIHDGYTGSVPISQSIMFFNKMLLKLYPDSRSLLVSDSLQLSLVTKQNNGSDEQILSISGRKVHLIRELAKLSLTVFEGTHEMLVPACITLLPNQKSDLKKNILIIGDSNGEMKNGYPTQIQNMLPFSIVINKSISGNTIGFDNLNNEKLNTLRNIETYLDSTFSQLSKGSKIDFLIIGLGTNDTKKIFDEKTDVVPKHLDSLIKSIKKYALQKNREISKIILLTPPPINEEITTNNKYFGSSKRIIDNNRKFQDIASNHGIYLIDTFSFLSSLNEIITTDGVHLTRRAQYKMGEFIISSLNKI